MPEIKRKETDKNPESKTDPVIRRRCMSTSWKEPLNKGENNRKVLDINYTEVPQKYL